MSLMDMMEMKEREMTKAAGGVLVQSWSSYDDCPVHGAKHVFKPTGESRKTDAWFYKTEERYKCDCGKSYWEAGYFCIRKYEN